MTETKKGPWEIADVLLRPVGGLLTALSVAFVGFWGSQYLEKRQAAETNIRLYAQLMSNRESSDSALRKDMFNLAISTFFEGQKFETEKQLLELELLAYNFHDALNLAPLFKHVERELEGRRDDPQYGEWKKRLTSVAQEVINKQVSVLEDAGIIVQSAVSLSRLDDEVIPLVDGVHMPRAPLTDPGVDIEVIETPLSFTVEALDFDAESKTLLVRLYVVDEELLAQSRDAPVRDDGLAPDYVLIDATFNVGFFDFPMIDNSRLPDGNRCAVVLQSFETSSADVALLYFPGSRASLKDKPYYDEIIDELVRTRAKWGMEESL